MSKHAFAVSGMHCGSCAQLIDETVGKLPGVTRSWTTVHGGRTEVEFDAARLTTGDVARAIEAHGYRTVLL